MPSTTDSAPARSALQDSVPSIRGASRRLVGELGFTHRTLAGTGLSAAALHALFEIGDRGVHDAAELYTRLGLNGSPGGDFKAAVEELLGQGEIVAGPGSTDSYRLTPRGEETLSAVNAVAVAVGRVREALNAAVPEADDTVVQGLRLYADALAATSPAPQTGMISAAVAANGPPPGPAVRIEPGYRPGFLARTLQMHVEYYHPTVAWGRAFETSLARDFGALIDRLAVNQDNQIWAAVQEPAGPGGGADRIVGTILLDAEDLGEPSTAHIRGFIVDVDARGLGVGKKLLAAVMTFVELRGFDKVVLFTMDRLAAAVHLYRSVGFELESVKDEMVWEQRVTVQKLVWRRTRGDEGVLS